MFLSSKRCLYSSLTSEMQVSPRTKRSKVSSSNTRSPPGRPRETPVTTYGSALRRSTCVDTETVCGVVCSAGACDIEVLGLQEDGRAVIHFATSAAVVIAVVSVEASTDASLEIV